MRACLNDRLSGKELAVSAGSISVWAGAGVVLGPFIEAMILRWLGPRFSFLSVSVLNALVLSRFAATLTETLAPEYVRRWKEPSLEDDLEAEAEDSEEFRNKEVLPPHPIPTPSPIPSPPRIPTRKEERVHP